MALKRTKGLLYRWPEDLKWRNIEGLAEGGDNAALPATPALEPSEFQQRARSATF